MGEVWTLAFRASSSSNASQINAGLCGLFRSQAAEGGIVCWHHTSDPSRSWKNFWGGVEAVPHVHREELVSPGCDEWWWEISIPCVHFHLHCSVQFPQEWPMLCLKPSYRARQRHLCSDGSSFLTFSHHYFVTLSWKTTGAAASAWLLCPDLSEQLKASFTHPHPAEYVLCVPTNLLTVLVIQSLTLW